MEKSRYPVWFLGTVLGAVAAMMAFNWTAGAYILGHPQGGSVQTLSGFERAIKPVWLAQIAPELVFVGSSRVRDGFDPGLIDPAFRIRSFNYGASSMSPYEARRFAQDALARPSVRTVVVALDAFTGNGGVGEALPSFDETRLSVTPSGAPTPRRGLWLFTTRFLSGGALGMNAIGAWSLAQLKPGQTASDRPDIFGAYSHMTQAVMDHDLAYRRARTLGMGPGAARELNALLDAACRTRARLVLFFPPDHLAIQVRYAQGDAAGLAAFKADVGAAVARHNAGCPTRIALFDFLDRNPLTAEPMANGQSPDYVDLVHFRPPAGVRLLRRMLERGEPGLGRSLAD
jgi:hypothetical protein